MEKEIISGLQSPQHFAIYSIALVTWSVSKHNTDLTYTELWSGKFFLGLIIF